jgi:hypothetical protein
MFLRTLSLSFLLFAVFFFWHCAWLVGFSMVVFWFLVGAVGQALPHRKHQTVKELANGIRPTIEDGELSNDDSFGLAKAMQRGAMIVGCAVIVITWHEHYRWYGIILVAIGAYCLSFVVPSVLLYRPKSNKCAAKKAETSAASAPIIHEQPATIRSHQLQSSTTLGTTDHVILSDTKGIDFSLYTGQLVDATRQRWLPLIPQVAPPPLNKQGKVGICFKIYLDGKVTDMTLDSPSGDVSLDRAAWGGITSALYSPLPKPFTGPFLEIRLHFSCNVAKE